MSAPKDVQIRTVGSAVVFTHSRPEETADAVRVLIDAADRAGVELRFDAEETAKHDLESASLDAVRANADPEPVPDICVVLGGDGSTLRALRAYVGRGVPVFVVNFGRVGFLATVDRDQLVQGLERALSGRFEVLRLPVLALRSGPAEHLAVNEVSFQRRSRLNITHLAYALGGEEVAGLPCDGLIAATAAGSTGYNLSVGGPILAWGVEGFVVSMIAPHALSARSLIAAPDDVLNVVNRGPEPVDVLIDGVRVADVGPGERAEVALRADAAELAQLPGSNFYRRFREKLGVLSG